MESCLQTNQVWEICSGLRPKPDEPLPIRDMIKEDYLALPDKTANNWKEYKVINKRYRIWADSNEKATNLIRRYVNETIQSELGRLSNAKIIWDHLERTYQQNIVASPYQLFYNLYNMRLTSNVSVTEYLESISRQAGELDQLGWKLPDSIIAALMVAGTVLWSVKLKILVWINGNRNGSRIVSLPTRPLTLGLLHQSISQGDRKGKGEKMVKRKKRIRIPQTASFVTNLVTTRITAGTNIQIKDPNGQSPRTVPK